MTHQSSLMVDTIAFAEAVAPASECQSNTIIDEVASDLEAISQRVAALKFAKPNATGDPLIPFSVAKSISLGRTKINQILDRFGLVDGPALNILLDIYMNQQLEKKVFVTDACLASGCPSTTGLRWIGVLVAAGLVSRAPDPADHRKYVLSLTQTGHETVLACLRTFSKEWSFLTRLA